MEQLPYCLESRQFIRARSIGQYDSFFALLFVLDYIANGMKFVDGYGV